MNPFNQQRVKPVKKNPILGQGTKTERHGKVFDSKLEADFYSALLNTGIEFAWQYEIVFYETTNKNPKLPLLKNRGITKKKLYVDFVYTGADGVTVYIDTKGSISHAKDKSRIKYDLLKEKLLRENHAHDSCIRWIETKHVKDLLTLSKLPNKKQFWDYLNALPNY